MRHVPRTLRWSVGLACAAAVVTADAAKVAAHPHVWISVETTVLVEQGSIVGFQHRWTFDEFYTAMAIQGLDTNNDGDYSRAELAELAQVNIDGLKDFAYFTYPKLGGQDLPVDAPKDYWLEHRSVPAGAASTTASTPPASEAPQTGMLARLRDAVIGPSKPDGAAPPAATAPAKQLTLAFTLPLKQPVLTEADGFSFSIQDPSWFIAFDMASAESIKLGPGAPANCRLEFGDGAAAGADDTKRLEDAFKNQFSGSGAVTLSGNKAVKLACGPRS